MGLFKKLFSKDDATSSSKAPKGYVTLTIAKLTKLSSDTVEVQLNVPDNKQSDFTYLPGQYLNFAIVVNGKEERRSYSICSGQNEPLAVAVKAIDAGKVSNWFYNDAVEGQELFVAAPHGHFTVTNEKMIVAIAAGSGITPIMSIAKSIENYSDRSLRLFFGNRTVESTIYKSAIDSLKQTSATYFLSQEEKEGFEKGRISKESFTAQIKANLDILKADGFYICGPEDMIFDIKDTLKLFGVADEKIHFELFTTPTHHAEESHTKTSDFTGKSKVKVIIDDEAYEFELDAKGKTILEKADSEGADAPYSCRGGVCSTCKAKVTKGKAVMDLNYSLTDKEIEDGYVLTCQAHPASEELIISYDE